MSRELQVIDMIAAIKSQTGGLELLVGSADHDKIRDVAEDWLDSGFTPETARQWWEAGGWDARDCGMLRDHGLTPTQCSKPAKPDAPESIAYAVCNSDLRVIDAVEMIM